MVEVRSTDRELSPGLHCFHQRYDLRGVQLVSHPRLETEQEELAVRRALDWLAALES
jgi:hypothetical protein